METIRTEKEKMTAGENYLAFDPILVAERKRAKVELAKINAITDDDARNTAYKSFLGSHGKQVHIEANFRFDYGYNIHLGENFYANYDCTFLDICPITIGENCMCAPGVQMYTAAHPIDPVERMSGVEFGKPITIGSTCWIGGSAVICPGVTLGNNVVVGAGSVVTKSFPDNVVIAGNPAKIIRTIEPKQPQQQ